LHLAFAMLRLAVGEYPDIGADAGVVEHIGWQADDGLDQIILQHIATDFALATARAAGKQRRTVEHNAKPAASILGRAHLGNQMQQEQHGAIGYARQARAETAIKALLLVFLADFLL